MISTVFRIIGGALVAAILGLSLRQQGKDSNQPLSVTGTTVMSISTAKNIDNNFFAIFIIKVSFFI